jgi:oligopeptide/dipeptide ABC transporter ATP-binding protein
VINQEKKRQVLQGEVPSPINKPKGCAFHTRCPHCMDICKEVEPSLVPNPNDPEHMCACHMFAKK